MQPFDPSIAARLLEAIQQRYKNPRFDFAPGRDKVLKGFKVDTGTGQGRKPSPKTWLKGLQALLDADSGYLFLYPIHFESCVLDVDSGPADVLTDFAPASFRSESRSGDGRCHLWYRTPRHPGDLEGRTSERPFTLRGADFRVGVQHRQIVRVPPRSVMSVLTYLAQVDLSTRKPFPYQVLGLGLQPGQRDTELYNLIAFQTEYLHPVLPDREIWYEVAHEIGYLAKYDDGDEKFNRTFESAIEAGIQRTTQDRGKGVYPFSFEGLFGVMKRIGMERFAYNSREGSVEVKVPGKNQIWAIDEHGAEVEDFYHVLRTNFRIQDSKESLRTWDPLENKQRFHSWLLGHAKTIRTYDPLSDIIASWDQVTPMGDDETLYSHFMDLSFEVMSEPKPGADFDDETDTETLSAQYQRNLRKGVAILERQVLLALYGRLVNYTTGGRSRDSEIIRFDHIILWIGKGGSGKSDYCRMLGLGTHHGSIELSQPPRDLGDLQQVAVVLELAELSDELTPRNRGRAKRYIESPTQLFRRAYDRDARVHAVQGIMMATAQKLPPGLDSGLRRRVIPVVVQAKDLGPGDYGQLHRALVDEHHPRAMSRAARDWKNGIRPRHLSPTGWEFLHGVASRMVVIDS